MIMQKWGLYVGARDWLYTRSEESALQKKYRLVGLGIFLIFLIPILILLIYSGS